MFRFLDGNPERTLTLMDYGGLPWWTVPEAKGSFWRPLTILTHWLDYRLWPETAWLMHAHSIAWYALLVATVCTLYRRMMGATAVAGLAAILYAVDDAHSMPAAWLANRNAIIAAVFGVLAILSHDRWRRHGRHAHAVIALLLTMASLLAAEAGVGTCAYLAAYAVCLDRGTWYKRAATLLPCLVVLVIWRIFWAAGGHGVQELGLYIDPVREPLVFAVNLLQRVPLLLLGQWALPPSESAIILSQTHTTLLVLFGVIVIAMIAVILTPLLRLDAVARFWALGMMLAVVPICASFPANRQLLFVGIGGMGLMARFVAQVLLPGGTTAPNLVTRRPQRILAWALSVVHLGMAPIALAVLAAYPMGFQGLSDQLHVRTPLDPSVEQQDLIIVNAPSVMHALYLSVQRELAGQPVPRRTRVLAPAIPAVTIRRLDKNTLSIRPEDSFICWEFDHLFRSKRRPMSIGQQVQLTGMTVEVTALTPDHRPAEALFRFSVPLEDSSLRWLQWKNGEFVPFVPPPVGTTVELRAASLDLF